MNGTVARFGLFEFAFRDDVDDFGAKRIDWVPDRDRAGLFVYLTRVDWDRSHRHQPRKGRRHVASRLLVARE